MDTTNKVKLYLTRFTKNLKLKSKYKGKQNG